MTRSPLYDALALNNAAVEPMGRDKLNVIATGVGYASSQDRHDRLRDKRPRQNQSPSKTNPTKPRATARPPGRGDQTRVGLSRTPLRRVGRLT
jgi:hypothetical protein